MNEIGEMVSPFDSRFPPFRPSGSQVPNIPGHWIWGMVIIVQVCEKHLLLIELGLLCLFCVSDPTGKKSRYPKYLKPGKFWYVCMLRSCRIVGSNTTLGLWDIPPHLHPWLWRLLDKSCAQSNLWNP